MNTQFLRATAAVVSLASPCLAQGVPDNQPIVFNSSQASSFSSEFNPAFSFVIDATTNFTRFNGATQDGFDADLRVLELGGKAWIDPSAWAFFVGATEGEGLAIEEAAINYVGLDSNSTFRAGRFFIDFGKQMQTHVHELRTVERPLVLRTFLGEEVTGDGIQWDHWVPAGDNTLVRWSAGAFSSLVPEESGLTQEGQENSVLDRETFGDLNFTARLTALSDISDSETLQAGASGRWIPDFTVEFEGSGDSETGLSSAVYGVDATYKNTNETGERVITLGSEWLTAVGDNNVMNPTPGTIDVINSSLTGYFAFFDMAWSQFDSAGIQYSAVELGDANRTRIGEVEAYYTHHLSEFQRLRFGVSSQSMENGEDILSAVVQYTATLGAHGHGVSW